MDLVAAIRDLAGDSLRSVAEYQETEYELYHVREDISAKNVDLDKIHQNLVLDGMGREFLEDLFDAGDLECTIHTFEQAQMIHFAFPNNSGLFLSVDNDGEVPLREVIDEGKRWYQEGRPGSAFEHS